MPRASMDGSIFPDLEREQMSTAHPPPLRRAKEAGRSNIKIG